MRIGGWTAILIATMSLPAARARADDPSDLDGEPVANARAVEKPDDGVDAARPKRAGDDAARPKRAGDVVRLAQIERDLALVREEEESTTRLWPVLTIALGVAAIATAATLGAVEALSCDDACHAGGWLGLTVIGGAAVATTGVVWLRWTNDDARGLATRRYRLERERDEIDASTGEPRAARPARSQALVLGVRGQF